MSQAGIVNVAGGGGAGTPIMSVNLQTGTTPIVPTANAITFNGATVAAGSNPVRTDGTGVSTMALEVQISQAIAGTDATKIGLAAFNSANFTVDANGFVSITSGGFQWIDQAISAPAVAETGYFTTAAVTMTLPAAPSQGATIEFIVDTASQLTIQANAGQTIRIGVNTSSVAGTAKSNFRGDTISLVFRSSNNTWIALDSQGTWTLA